MSDSSWPRGLQHARLPRPSPSPKTCSDSCALSLGCHLTISSSVVPFSSYLQSFPTSGSFQMSQLFTSGDRSTGASASACPSNEYSELVSFTIDWFDLLAVQGTLKSLHQHQSPKASILLCSAHFMVQLSHHTWLLEKTIALTDVKVMSLLSHMQSRLVIDFHWELCH